MMEWTLNATCENLRNLISQYYAFNWITSHSERFIKVKTALSLLRFLATEEKRRILWQGLIPWRKRAKHTLYLIESHSTSKIGHRPQLHFTAGEETCNKARVMAGEKERKDIMQTHKTYEQSMENSLWQAAFKDEWDERGSQRSPTQYEMLLVLEWLLQMRINWDYNR